MKKFLETINKAVAFERKNSYYNAQGVNNSFSAFIVQEIADLAGKMTNDYKIQIRLNRLKKSFTDYPDLCVADRKKLVEELLTTAEDLTGEKKEPKIVREKVIVYQDNNDPDWEKKSVQYLRGIGPKLAENLARAGINNIRELLHYYPRKHLNYAQRTKIREAKTGMRVTIWGTIKSVECFNSPKNKNITILSITVTDGTGSIKASWFYGRANKFMQDQYKKRYPIGAQVLLGGEVKIDKFTHKLAVDKPEVEILGELELEEGQNLHTGRIVPVYPLVEGLNLRWLRKTIKAALEIYGSSIRDPLPDWLKKEFNLLNLPEALAEFHFPTDYDLLEKARKRLVFDELFYLQLGFAFRRKQEELHLQGINFSTGGPHIEKFLANLSFRLTQAQERVFREISADLSSPKPMNRLVQGDVGSGKTIVALLTLLVAIQNGYQGAMMAPTEILAEQHFRKFKSWLDPLGLNTVFLTGSQTKKERTFSLEEISSGRANIVVGTHALIQDEVNFHRLGLVIVDEQHRFGVKQRVTLKNKGMNPEVLTMTATPIPRTLALTLHGDLDVSVIDELPPGRKPINTRFLRGNRTEAWVQVRKEVEKGRQAYIVFPLIEESETLSARAATVEAERLQEKVFPDRKIALLHGKMKNSEKDEVMKSFTIGETDILVSTTVIEVGVDVPNATIMVIENAERFGLAQLHQLRGRVGRGSDESHCLLLSDKPSDISEKRLEIMQKTNDGFVIAEQDLRIRGPGEFLGTRQSGLPDLILANLAEDTKILEEARNAAKMLVEKDNELKDFKHGLLKQELYRYFRFNKDYLLGV